MALDTLVDNLAGRVSTALVNVNVSGQEVTGGDSGTDAPIYLGGKAWRFNCADVAGIAQVSPAFPNFLRTEIVEGQRAPYDETNDRPYLRTEVYEIDRAENTGLEYWIAFTVYLLDGSGLLPWPDEGGLNGQAMICQIKVSPDDTSGAPQFRIEARSNCIRITAAGNAGGGAEDVLTDWTSDPLAERVPVSFIVQSIRSADGTSGTIRVWRDGVSILDQSGIPVGHSTTEYVYAKFGLYCRNTVASASIIHTDIQAGADLSPLLARPYPTPNLGY